MINLIRISSVKKIIMTTNTIGSLADEVVQTLTALDSTWPSRISEPPRLSQLFPHLAGGGELLEEEDHTPSTSVVKPDLKSTCIYLHSSGSTGLPKAIPISHHEAIKYMRFRMCHRILLCLLRLIHGLQRLRLCSVKTTLVFNWHAWS